MYVLPLCITVEVASSCGFSICLGSTLSRCARVTSAAKKTVDEVTASEVRL